MNRTLPNGNTIVAIDFEAGIILSSVDKYRVTEYVTHAFYRGDLHSTSVGHYMRDLSEARKDFEERVKRGY